MVPSFVLFVAGGGKDFAQEVFILRSQLVLGRKAGIREALLGQFHFNS